MAAYPFIPPCLPLSAQADQWGDFGCLSSRAMASLGFFSGMMASSPRSDPFWFVWLLKESQASSEIEGTRTSLDEILESHAGLLVPGERRQDVQEVVNYRQAMQEGGRLLRQGMPFSGALARGLHGILLAGVRGQGKEPGNYRSIPVHIGKPGQTLAEAIYIPPPPEHIRPLLDNLFAFAARDDIDPLLQTAILHAQFEMIHPFMDGNGRLGRLLISLFLAHKNLLEKPQFYLSSWLNAHRAEYYTRLGNISAHGDWQGWLGFFITAIAQKSQENIQILKNTNALYDKYKNELPAITKSAHALAIMDYVFSRPLFTLRDLARAIGASPQGADRLIKKLQACGVFSIHKKNGGNLPTVWRFNELWDLLAS